MRPGEVLRRTGTLALGDQRPQEIRSPLERCFCRLVLSAELQGRAYIEMRFRQKAAALLRIRLPVKEGLHQALRSLEGIQRGGELSFSPEHSAQVEITARQRDRYGNVVWPIAGLFLKEIPGHHAEIGRAHV